MTDLSPADWVVDRVDSAGFGVVAGLLPSGFAAYARVLHPAAQSRGDESQAVSWAEVAQANKRRMHHLVQFDALIGVDRDKQDEYMCAIGEVPNPIREPFLDVLARHTDTADDCWFGLWDGWGGVEGGPSFSVPQRDYILLRGSLDGVDEIPGDLWPSLFWPDDHAWCVATDIDLDSTYVGGTAALITALLGHPSFEAWPARAEDRIDVGADQVNPPPRMRH